MSMVTAGGLPRGTTALWVINVYDRFWDLEVQLEIMRQTLVENFRVHVYCSGPVAPNVGPLINVVHRPSDSRQNGFRDALQYTARAGTPYDLVVSTHAKTWATDMFEIQCLLGQMLREDRQFMYLDDGPRGAMMTGKRDSMYCDFLALPGELSSLLWSRKNFQREFPEVIAYEHMLHHITRPMPITHTGGRLTNGDSGKFVFSELGGDPCLELLCGYVSEEKFQRLKLKCPRTYSMVEDIHTRWKGTAG